MKRHIVKALATLAVLSIAAAAFAYWSATGSGSGSATTANPGAQSVTVNQTSASSGLYPGGSVPLSGNFDNSAANAVHVNGVTATVTGTDHPGCTAADYAISGTSAIAGGGSVASGNGKGGWSGLTLSMIDNPTSDQGACKGATVSISYSAN
jgi:hypothetical protein